MTTIHLLDGDLKSLREFYRRLSTPEVTAPTAPISHRILTYDEYVEEFGEPAPDEAEQQAGECAEIAEWIGSVSELTAATYGDLDIAQLINEQKARMGLSTIEIAQTNLVKCRTRKGRDEAFYVRRLDEEILKASRVQ